jgi:AcrR family transcriptional regulator
MKKPRISPRKSPQQGRSRGLVESVVTAATRVLVKQGYEGATTNRVAEVAGVSIGSLYQYFPNKDALVGAVIDKAIERHVGRIEAAIAKVRDRPLDDALRVLIAAAYDLHFENLALFREIFVRAPQVDRLQNILRARRHVAALLTTVLDSRGIRLRDPELAIFVLHNATLGVLHAAVFAVGDAAPPVDHRDRLIDELTRLSSSYLTAITERF